MSRSYDILQLEKYKPEPPPAGLLAPEDYAIWLLDRAYKHYQKQVDEFDRPEPEKQEPTSLDRLFPRKLLSPEEVARMAAIRGEAVEDMPDMFLVSAEQLAAFNAEPEHQPATRLLSPEEVARYRTMREGITAEFSAMIDRHFARAMAEPDMSINGVDEPNWYYSPPSVALGFKGELAGSRGSFTIKHPELGYMVYVRSQYDAHRLVASLRDCVWDIWPCDEPDEVQLAAIGQFIMQRAEALGIVAKLA